jgi:hypothetical protein
MNLLHPEKRGLMEGIAWLWHQRRARRANERAQAERDEAREALAGAVASIVEMRFVDLKLERALAERDEARAENERLRAALRSIEANGKHWAKAAARAALSPRSDAED